MAPLAAAAATMAVSHAHAHATAAPAPTQGVAFKVQTKSAVALVKERRIEFVRARNARTLARIDEATGKVLTTAVVKKKREVVVESADVERLLQWKHSKKIGPGFANLGNTCYLNSVLQCLSYTPSFVQFLLQKEMMALFGAAAAGGNSKHSSGHGGAFQKKPMSNGFCAARVMSRLLQSVHGVGGTAARVLQPKELVMNIRHISKNFRIGRQEDSHEFFRLLLDAMQRSCLRKAHIKQESDPAATTTLIHRAFGGKLKNSLKCAKCKYVSERLDDFLDLSLEINNGINSIKGALKHFTATETLDDSNAWKCSSCKQPNRAEKGMTIDTCPNVLVIQLKRFDGMYGKIKKHIEFGSTLDLSIGMSKASEDRRRGRSRYELHAVLVHAGFSTNCGHYYAFVKGSSGQWYEMNDECVRWVSVETVLQQKAYMLFYSRVLPASEQPPPKEKPKAPEAKPVVEAKATAADVGVGVLVKPTDKPKSTVAAAPSRPELNLNGFLSSLKTDLTIVRAKELGASSPKVAAVERTSMPVRSVTTYKVSVASKQHRTLKRRLVPVFAGAVGKLVRFRSVGWKASMPLRMVTEETKVGGGAASPPASVVAPVSPAMAPSKPTVIVEKSAFNPRALRGFGEQNSALYGKTVDQWAGDAPESVDSAVENGNGTLDNALAAKRERVLKNMKEEDWKRRKAQRKSSWDETLDLGKVKKIKKRAEFVANQGVANAFQLALARKKQRQ